MKKILLLSVFIFLAIVLFAQPNLILSSGSILQTSIKRGDHLNLKFRVSNTGNATAGKSHTQIYVSNTLSFT